MTKEFRPTIDLGVRSSRHGRSTMMVKCPFIKFLIILADICHKKGEKND